MAYKNQIATVFGGSGFVGCQIVRELAAKGFTVKIATRVPERANALKPCGAVGQVVPVLCDYSDAHSVREAVKNADYVVNCIGILFEKGKRRRFQNAHVDIPAMIAKSCADEGVSRFVHISALGCDTGTSKYAKSKSEGEEAVLANFPSATVLRPSVIFGADDNFFNMFAEMSRYVPVLPLIGGGKTKFQPVFVGDVADCVMAALTSDGYQGKVYQLGGADVVSLHEIYELLFEHTGRKRSCVSLPFSLAKVQASFLSLLPKPPLTPDQVESLKTDNIVDEKGLNMQHLGVEPTSMDLILPSYLESYQSGGSLSNVASL
ncbi:MAG: complex I NDUFA9 subunit family protein [Alphaproteobacteria bacterium]